MKSGILIGLAFAAMVGSTEAAQAPDLSNCSATARPLFAPAPLETLAQCRIGRLKRRVDIAEVFFVLFLS